MRNVSSIISGHNKYVLNGDRAQPETRMCNCRRNAVCPLSGKCLTRNFVYCGKVFNRTDDLIRPYVGLTSTTFKERLGNHIQGIRHKAKSNSCELTKHIWELKDSGKEFSVGWEIIEHVKGRLVGGECKLCVTEKLHIIEHPDQDTLLNSNCNMKCLHKWKYKLSSVGDDGRGRTRKRRGEVCGTNSVT